MRYMLTIEIPCAPDQGNFKFSKKLKSKFTNYDQFVEEIQQMIDSGELRRMVEGMTEYHNGEEKMREKWNEGVNNFSEKKQVLMPCPTCGLRYWRSPDYVMPKQCSPSCGEKEIREATRK